MIDSIHASMADAEQSQLNKSVSTAAIESMKADINKLFRLKRIDQQEFEQLKSIIGYRDPNQKQLERIYQFRLSQAKNKFQSVVNKLVKPKLEAIKEIQMQKEQVEEKNLNEQDSKTILDLTRQDQLQRIREKARPKIDYKWS